MDVDLNLNAFPKDIVSEWRKAFKKAKPNSDNDKKILEYWFIRRNITPNERTQALATFRSFRDFTRKTFADCTRDDGRKFVDFLFEKGFKTGTVQRKVGYLSAACNIAVDEKKLITNPFARLIDKRERRRKDKVKRAILTNDEILRVEEVLENRGHDERLLWHLLRWTGMRRSEAWHIKSEDSELGIRCIRIGGKTEQSDRRIPMPSQLLPLLPSKIEGCLFQCQTKRAPDTIGKRLLRVIRDAKVPACQPASKRDPLSASKRDPSGISVTPVGRAPA